MHAPHHTTRARLLLCVSPRRTSHAACAPPHPLLSSLAAQAYTASVKNATGIARRGEEALDREFNKSDATNQTNYELAINVLAVRRERATARVPQVRRCCCRVVSCCSLLALFLEKRLDYD